MRKLVRPLVPLGLALFLVSVAFVASASAGGPASHAFTDDGMTIRLTSAMPGVTFAGNTLVCPSVLITTSSGQNMNACQFTISSVGAVAPSSLTVSMNVTGATSAQIAADKFAVAPRPGTLVHFRATSQTLYTFAGADLPATVNPGVVWGGMAGTPLDNSDMGATIVVTYTVVAESIEGATAPPTLAPTRTSLEIVRAETASPVRIATAPPTGSTSNRSTGESASLFALLVCLVLGGLGLVGAISRRRGMRRSR